MRHLPARAERRRSARGVQRGIRFDRLSIYCRRGRHHLRRAHRARTSRLTRRARPDHGGGARPPAPEPGADGTSITPSRTASLSCCITNSLPSSRRSRTGWVTASCSRGRPSSAPDAGTAGSSVEEIARIEVVELYSHDEGCLDATSARPLLRESGASRVSRNRNRRGRR